MPIRCCKIALSGASAFFLFLVVFNNVFDYGSNFAFVQHVLSMSDTFEGNSGMWRAIEAPWVHHAFYLLIIGWEFLAFGIISLGTWKLWQARKASAATWEKAKHCTIVGHTLSLLQWYVAFLTVGAEWFLMWQSKVWNGQGAAHRMFVVMGLVMLFIFLRDRDPAEDEA